MGAIVAYETACLRKIMSSGPLHIFLSARAAPFTRECDPLRFLDDETFIDRLHRTYGEFLRLFGKVKTLKVFLHCGQMLNYLKNIKTSDQSL